MRRFNPAGEGNGLRGLAAEGLEVDVGLDLGDCQIEASALGGTDPLALD